MRNPNKKRKREEEEEVNSRSAFSHGFQVPSVSTEDLTTFYLSHFSTTARDSFAANFLHLTPPGTNSANQQTEPEANEADDLGYYPDGVKRTLTDEQIAIFRHSEIQAILRERRHKAEAYEAGEGPLPAGESEEASGDLLDEEAEDDDEAYEMFLEKEKRILNGDFAEDNSEGDDSLDYGDENGSIRHDDEKQAMIPLERRPVVSYADQDIDIGNVEALDDVGPLKTYMPDVKAKKEFSWPLIGG